MLGYTGDGFVEGVDVVGDTGKAVGLAVILRGVVMNARGRVSYMPRELCGDCGVEERELFGEGGRVVFEVVGRRVGELVKGVDAVCEGFGMGEGKALWVREFARIYCGELEKKGWNCFDEGLQRWLKHRYPLRLQWVLLKKKLFGSR